MSKPSTHRMHDPRLIVPHIRLHLPNENYITYTAKKDMSRILSQEFLHRTMLTEWFVANQNYSDGRNLTYCDFPSKWRWNDQVRTWERRQKGAGKIGRIYFVHPSCGERYYLRMLLLTVKGATSYESLQMYNDISYSTFKEACNAHGLLSNDQEWYNAFDEAAHWATSNQLMQLFITMLLFCEVGDEYLFFEKVWKLLTYDIQYNMRKVVYHKTYQMSDTDLKDQLLETLETMLNKRGSNITDFNLPWKSTNTTSQSINCLFDEELCYDTNNLLSESEYMIGQLNSEQQYAFHSIVDTVLDNKLGFFFVSGYRGTGKTFVWNTIITYLRGHRKIVLSVASSGVASLLLPGRRTTHSRFRIPCGTLDESTTCNIKCGTMLCKLIQAASLNIWDEALMTHRIAFDALDRTLCDILSMPLNSKKKCLLVEKANSTCNTRRFSFRNC
jgi:hypothetical protein